MSSLQDKKAKYWERGIDTDLAITSDEDTIDRLLVNTDFDAYNIPEHREEPPLFATSSFTDINVPDVIQKKSNTISLLTTEPFSETTNQDKYDKATLKAEESTTSCKPIRTLSSLAQNNTKSEKVFITDRFIVRNFITAKPENPAEQKPNLPLTQVNNSKNTSASTAVPQKIAEPPRTLQDDVNASISNAEWQRYKTEQDKIAIQQKKRILILENNLKKAVLFSHIALILAGIALITVVSLLL